ncbi:hypothetical protein O1L55_00480 [Streptomyces albulus]|nr:hypothetical protein [Streptomyces noursei]
MLVQLGGLGNPAGHTSGRVYLALVERLLAAVRDDSAVEMTAAMNHANGAFTLRAGVPVRQLSAADFHTALGRCDVVLSSPGMTTLVEVSRAGRPYVPLPPQNWSQVLICRHLSARSAHDLWPFLTAPYDGIAEGAPEAAKAVAVQEVNRRLGRDDGYAARYARLARHAVGNPETPDLGAPSTGRTRWPLSWPQTWPLAAARSSRRRRQQRHDRTDHGTHPIRPPHHPALARRRG